VRSDYDYDYDHDHDHEYDFDFLSGDPLFFVPLFQTPKNGDSRRVI